MALASASGNAEGDAPPFSADPTIMLSIASVTPRIARNGVTYPPMIRPVDSRL